MAFELSRPLTVPINYQHLLQAFVYSIIPEEKALFLHSKGFQHRKRVYKAFTFSQIQGKTAYDKKTKSLTFYNNIRLSISSIMPQLIEKVSNDLMLSDDLTLHGVPMKLLNLSYDQHHITENIIKVKALSPITVYSTFERRNGKKFTHYFTPFDRVFSHLIEENFARKYEAVTEETLPQGQLIDVRNVHVTSRHKVVTKYKGVWVTGWLGTYEISGDPKYLSFILGAGVGSKNSMGHGMVVRSDYETLPKRN